MITPNQTMGSTDHESIQNAIALAKETGANEITIPKRNERTGKELWVIEDAILLPDDMKITVDGAHLMQADGVFCNMFVTENYGTNNGKEQKNITITGKNGAILDGGTYNGLCEGNSNKNGMPHISKNTMLLFYHATGVEVSSLKIINQRWWAITNIFVTHSKFSDLEFQADFSRVDENGVHHPDEQPQTYAEVYVKNADGIDLRVGCHHIEIENISGFTEDDTVALTALKGTLNWAPAIEGLDLDIHHVTIRNVVSNPYCCANLRLLCAEGTKIYEVLAENIKDLRKEHTYSTASVKIGDMGYSTQYATPEDVHHITVRNVDSRAPYGVMVSNGLGDSLIESVTGTGAPFGIGGQGTLNNVTVRLT
ncbi:MAG: hypothetical protein E7399_01000 [Ruminococcaceae bacterium]|nr:hypothetical protein [Oscillospiraceae bacterium]